MAWQFRNDAPIYTQLVAQIKLRIVAGTFQPGQRLPAQFFQAMAKLGYARAEIVALVEQSGSKEAQDGDSGM